ncbi:hypothetical protein SpCBS45565_g02724 [Spizellomyces sp. 'palustris']|nr:hypothetical protein SpCBS45565_g02724 [Spizellomyces sp. 'palustris']
MAKSRERKRRKMTGPKRGTILLILDINGTLLERVKKSAEKKAARANPLCPEAPNFRLNKARCYYRPYLDTFIDHIFQHFEVAAWTSAMPKNADPMFRHIFGDYAPKLAFGWNRSHCSDIGGQSRDWEAKKDLRKVWADRAVNPRGRWSERNTILIDDTSSKASFTPANCLHLPTFTVCDPNFDCINDTSLLSLIKYLDEIRQSAVTDVREYFKTHPAFHVAETGNATHPHEQFAIQDIEDEELISRFAKDRPRLADHNISSSDEERPSRAHDAEQSRIDRASHPERPFQRFENQQTRGYHSQTYMRQHSGYHRHRSDDVPMHEGQTHRQPYGERESRHDSYGFYQDRAGTSSRHPVKTSDQRDFQRYDNRRHQDVLHPSKAPTSNGIDGNWRQRADNEGGHPTNRGKGKKGESQPRANSKGRTYHGGKFSKQKKKTGGG